MVPLSKRGRQICESLCVTGEQFLFRGALMPFSAPESSGIAVSAVWTWWCWWLLRECVCWLGLQTSWLLSFERPQHRGPSQDTALQSGRFGLSLAFQSLCFVCLSSGPARSLVRLLLHTSLFSPALRLLLLVFPSSRFFFITGPFWALYFILCTWKWSSKSLVLSCFLFTASKQ